MLGMVERSESRAREGWRDPVTWIAPAAILAVALLLRAWRLTAECPWYDEIITLEYFHTASLPRFLEAVAPQSGAVPPLYFALEYAWSHWVLPSETSLRWLSICFGELTILFTYLIGRRLFGRLAGCVAAIGLAVNPTHVFYSQEIRMYALVYLLATISVYTFLGLLQRWNRRAAIAHALTNLLLAWTHPYGLLIGIPEGLVLLASRQRSLREKAWWVAAHLLIGVSILAWLYTRDTKSVLDGMSWLGKPKILSYPGTTSIEAFLVLFLGGDVSAPAGSIMRALFPWRWLINHAPILILFASAGLVTWNEFRRTPKDGPRASAFLWLWFAVPPLLLFVLSHVWLPCFVDRYVFYCAIAAYLFFGGCIAMGKRTRIPFVVLLALFATYQAATVLSQPRRADWRAAAQAINASSESSHPVIVMKYQCAYAVQYYLGRSRPSVLQARDVPDVLAKAATQLRDAKGVWLLVNDIGTAPIQNGKRLDEMLHQAHVEFTKRTFQAASPVSLYHVESNAVQNQRLDSILQPLNSGGRPNGP